MTRVSMTKSALSGEEQWLQLFVSVSSSVHLMDIKETNLWQSSGFLLILLVFYTDFYYSTLSSFSWDSDPPYGLLACTYLVCFPESVVVTSWEYGGIWRNKHCGLVYSILCIYMILVQYLSMRLKLLSK